MKVAYMEGCGNRFFVADAMEMALSDSEMKETYHRHNSMMQVDGALFLSKSEKAKLRMNYFDVDRRTGKLYRASMCGNGIRCIARFAKDLGHVGSRFSIETDNGVKDVMLEEGFVTVNMGVPGDYRKLSDTDYYIHVGLPHYVRFTDHLDSNRTREEGSILRYDRKLLERLGNPKDILHFDSVRVDGDQEISILTREGGVEDITLACGTGSTASAYVGHMARSLILPITVHNPGGDMVVNKASDNQIIMSGPADYI